MAATPSGKNKTQRYMRLIWNGRDLSGAARTFGQLTNQMGGVDMSGWSDEVRTYLADMAREVGVSGLQVLMDNTGGTGAYTRLKDADESGPLDILFGGGGGPTVPDPAYMLSAVQLSAVQGLDSAAVILNVDAVMNAGDFGTFAGNPWGVVLARQNFTATTSVASHDNGAASANGWRAHLHVTSSVAGNYAFDLEQSSDDGAADAWASFHTFTATGNQVASEIASGTGAIEQYVRLTATRTAGSCFVICTFSRD